MLLKGCDCCVPVPLYTIKLHTTYPPVCPVVPIGVVKELVYGEREKGGAAARKVRDPKFALDVSCFLPQAGEGTVILDGKSVTDQTGRTETIDKVPSVHVAGRMGATRVVPPWWQSATDSGGSLRRGKTPENSQGIWINQWFDQQVQ